MGLTHMYRGLLFSSSVKNMCTYSVMKQLRILANSSGSNKFLLKFKSCDFSFQRSIHLNHQNEKLAVNTEKKSEPKSGLNKNPETIISNINSKKELNLIKRDNSKQKGIYSEIVGSFPEGIQMAFAYGSGAFQQENSPDVNKNVLDFILVVDMPRRWHRLNLDKHPHHYSFLKRFGPHTIARVQERYGAGVYFNTLVPMQGRVIKYGVISTARLITDLLDWESLYISGRLHKPVSLIVEPLNEQLLTALKVNLRSAFHAALLLLPDMFTEVQLYSTIAGLSYAGDFRMSIAEDRNKVSNIVKPNLQLFRRMYGPIIMEEEHLTWWQPEGQLEQALTFHSRHHHLKCLPGQVLYGLLMQKYQV
ncbi:phosphatidate cytidylyltransferase, mitochondrial-like isoform X2 [Physella acuta]|nr:phosphatidate cytidylyltransferase, mitochondrial-like isoform X2 [Physella acuta]